jgi:hypothetical protein
MVRSSGVLAIAVPVTHLAIAKLLLLCLLQVL